MVVKVNYLHLGKARIPAIAFITRTGKTLVSKTRKKLLQVAFKKCTLMSCYS